MMEGYFDSEILISDLKGQLDKVSKELLEAQKELSETKERQKELEHRHMEDCVKINQLHVTVSTLVCMYAQLQETADLI